MAVLRSNVRRRTSIFASALVLTSMVGALAAPVASAASRGTITVNCSSGPWGTTSMTGSVGDTFVVTNSGSSTSNCLLSQTNAILGGVTTPLTPGSSITVTMSLAGTTVLSIGTGGSNFVNVNVTVSAAPTPPAEPATAAVWHLQQVPLPASGSCIDVQDSALAWGTDVTGGWTRAWGDWANAWVCSRALTDAGGTWHVADA